MVPGASEEAPFLVPGPSSGTAHPVHTSFHMGSSVDGWRAVVMSENFFQGAAKDGVAGSIYDGGC